MTEIVYNAVVASTESSEDVTELISWCANRWIKILIVQMTGNGVHTLLLPPHGFKRYADRAKVEDDKRAAFKDHLDRLEGWRWLEVQYDDWNHQIVALNGSADIAGGGLLAIGGLLGVNSLQLETLPELREVHDKWDSLSEDEQYEIWVDFQEACIDGGREPSDYWYPLLMPRFMDGYVGH